jgi:hypothetical protein
MRDFIIMRIFEDRGIIIYKRMFNLKNCGGDKRYFEVQKREKACNINYGKQFRSITQVKKYIHERGTT